MSEAEENVPVIIGPYGKTTEVARKQAVLNLRRDPAKLKMMIEKFGEERIRRDYPEVWAKDEDSES